MLHTVRKVEHIEKYKLKLHFNDRRIKIVNLDTMLKGAKNLLARLTDINYFKKVKCDGTTIFWPNGVDLCPDVLYKMGEDVRKLPSKHYRSTRRGKVISKNVKS